MRFAALTMLAMMTAAVQVSAEDLPVPLFAPATQRATTAPALRMDRPILPAPDAHPTPRATTLPALPQLPSPSPELPELKVAKPTQPAPAIAARRRISQPPAPFPPLVLPQPPLSQRAGSTIAASTITGIPVTSDKGPGPFPLLRPLIRTNEIPIADFGATADNAAPPKPILPDDDPPVRPAQLPPRPPMQLR